MSLHICQGIVTGQCDNVSRSHVLAAKALVSLRICAGSPEPRHSKEKSCAGSNGDLCIPDYVNSKCCGEPAPATMPSVPCINATKKGYQCVVIKFLNKTLTSLPKRKKERYM